MRRKGYQRTQVRMSEREEDSFIKLMLTANDMIVRLKARVTLISRKRESNDCLRTVTFTHNELQPIIERATREITLS